MDAEGTEDSRLSSNLNIDTLSIPSTGYYAKQGK
jgi:hypothetical protein